MNIYDPNNAEVLRLAVLIFLIDAFVLTFDGLRNVLIGVTRGLFDTKFPMYMNLLAIWIFGMPLSYLLAFRFHQGVVGIVLGGLISVIFGAVIMLHRWHMLSKKYNFKLEKNND